jgi:hypothetical protein
MKNETNDLCPVDDEPDEPGGILYQHTVLAQTCLPYRDPGDECRAWERTNGTVGLRLAAGSAFHPKTGEWVQLGLPFGPKPRLILAHLNAEALRTGSPEIEVEDTLSAFVRRLGLHRHGRNIRTVKDQLARLATAEIRLAAAYSDQETRQLQTHLIGAFDLWFPKDERQRVLWPFAVRLSTDYFESLQRHAVPLHEHALAALAHNAMALDVYAWLAQRLHRVDIGKPKLVPWKALRDQFGWHYNTVREFRRVFRSTLQQVLTQYPGARLELDHRGMVLHHSPPPVLCRRSRIITGSKTLDRAAAEDNPLGQPD